MGTCQHNSSLKPIHILLGPMSTLSKMSLSVVREVEIENIKTSTRILYSGPQQLRGGQESKLFPYLLYRQPLSEMLLGVRRFLRNI